MDDDIDSEELTMNSDVDSSPQSDISEDDTSTPSPSPPSQEEEYSPVKPVETVRKPPRTKAGTIRKRGVRCMECPACLRQDDCGRCEFCKDKRKFGGPAIKKQACMWVSSLLIVLCMLHGHAN